MDPEQEFFEAIKSGNTQAVTALLEADPLLAESTTEEGTGPLLLAAYCGQHEMVSHLVALGATPTIFAAAALGELRRIDLVVADNPDAVHDFSGDGWTALHLAAHFGHADVVAALLSMGADIEAVSRNSTAATPLHSAAAGRSAPAVRILLEHGAGPNATEPGGYIALDIAEQNGDKETAELLREFGDR